MVAGAAGCNRVGHRYGKGSGDARSWVFETELSRTVMGWLSCTAIQRDQSHMALGMLGCTRHWGRTDHTRRWGRCDAGRVERWVHAVLGLMPAA
ncbi:hypothetical protein AMTR_s00047p00047710 [Amborella trichopoda]|uniref:Uncharacterized protein n=1 Tax=Amborella trichopoda TaxID=13333 RepID=U5CWK6_AMBTC|nr:hypothetical protein AMTR_s00047p00047710 [Amborella trichopoda]